MKQVYKVALGTALVVTGTAFAVARTRAKAVHKGPAVPKVNGFFDDLLSWFDPSLATSSFSAGPDTSPASGVLAKAVASGEFVQPAFVDVPCDDLIITVGADMLKVEVDGRKLRMFCSWPETIQICKTLGYVAPNKEICDAIYAAAQVKTAFHSLVTPNDPASGGAKMHTWEDVKKYNADVDSQLSRAGWDSSTLQSGAEKYWIFHPRLAEQNANDRGATNAINYGGWDANGHPLQPVSGAHSVNYPGDYSQLLRPILRYARRGDEKVDLLDWITSRGVPSQFTDQFR